ncbi:peptidase M12 [Tenacibaculum sp. Bg11-29]|nr:peptidase M12 [Tenacibaculum sp. Bg11-29]
MKTKCYYALLISLSLFTACNENENSENLTNQTAPSLKTELAFPGQSGEIKKGFYQGVPVTYEVIEGQYVMGGDVILPKEHVYDSLDGLVLEPGQKPNAKKRSAGATTNRWPNSTVYYTIGSAPNKSYVRNAIAHWQSKTNLKFVKRTNQPNYISFDGGSGCSSAIGMQGGRQVVTLGTNRQPCQQGSVIHEIGHAIGLFHEQSRSDRDSYVKIIDENIIPNMKYNFDKYSIRYHGSDNTPFDFNSIMMYADWSFSKNGRPTITRLNGSSYSTQRNGLSPRDIAGIKKMYPSSAGGDTSGGTTYHNNQDYTLHGLKVHRQNNLWWFHDGKDWRQVELKGTSWYYV